MMKMKMTTAAGIFKPPRASLNPPPSFKTKLSKNKDEKRRRFITFFDCLAQKYAPPSSSFETPPLIFLQGDKK